MYLNTVSFNHEQVFHRGNWKASLEIDTEHTGTGITVAEADQLSRMINLDQLLAYNYAVKENSLVLIDSFSSWTTDNLDNESELDRRLKATNAFPEGIRQERAKALRAYSHFRRNPGCT